MRRPGYLAGLGTALSTRCLDLVGAEYKKCLAANPQALRAAWDAGPLRAAFTPKRRSPSPLAWLLPISLLNKDESISVEGKQGVKHDGDYTREGEAA